MNFFESVEPQQVGISANSIEQFLNAVEENHICLHSCMMIRKDKVALEAYWDPIQKNDLHRLYSATKTFVSMGIGLLIDRGKLSLQDKITTFFPDLVQQETIHPFLADTTICDLLRMTTPYSQPTYGDPDILGKDWLASYFNSIPNHPSGTIFNYDSCGSYVLGAIIRRITGKQFYEFLRDEILDELDFDKASRCLLGPDGEGWAGSGILLSLRDFAKFAVLLLHKGRWNHKQLISEEYVTAATTKQVDNNTDGANSPWNCGYGYQIWILKDGAFCMWGAGSQLAICIPEKEFVFVCTADTQGYREDGPRKIFDILWKEIVREMDQKISDTPQDYKRLLFRCDQLKMMPVSGQSTSSCQEKINHRTYHLYDNKMGITEITLHLEGNMGNLEYCNARGSMKIVFGIGYCISDKFPETHFHGDVLGEPAGRCFTSINSGAWVEECKFVIRCNIVDDYVGNLTIALSFKEHQLALSMYKNAQFFLKDYCGYAGGVQI